MTQSPYDEWKEMPEFVQEKQEPYKKLTVRFDTAEAYQDFAERIGQKLTEKTKAIWHPALVRGIHSGKEYVDQ